MPEKESHVIPEYQPEKYRGLRVRVLHRHRHTPRGPRHICFFRGTLDITGRVSVDARARGHSDGSQCSQIRTSRSQHCQVRAPQRRPRLYINHFGCWPSCSRSLTTLRSSPVPSSSLRSHPRGRPRPFTCAPTNATLFWASRTCVRCASPCR